MSELLIIPSDKRRSKIAAINLEAIENDKNLSWKAIGVLTYLMTRSSTWKILISDLINRHSDGRDSIYSGINELIKHKYVYRHPIKDEKKRFLHWIYLVFSTPIKLTNEEINNLLAHNPLTDKPLTENPDKGNTYAYLKDINISKKNNYSTFPKEESYKSTKRLLQSHPKNDFLIYWKELKIRKHKPNTKTFQTALKYLNQLQQGTFQTNKVISKDFLKKNNIPNEWLSKKWKKEQIKKVLKNYSKCFIDGYWPKDKTNLTKNLSDFLYNPKSQTSLFFQVMANRPCLLEANKPDISAAIGAIIKQSCFLDQDIPNKVIYNIQSLQKWFDLIDRKFVGYKWKDEIPRNVQRLKQTWPTFIRFIEDYCYFLVHQKQFDFFPHRIFTIDSLSFQEFLKEMEEDVFNFKLMFKEE